MLNALKEIKKILDIIKQMVSINKSRIEAQDKRIKSLERLIDKYIIKNDAVPFIPDEIIGDPTSELMINDPDDGSWVGR